MPSQKKILKRKLEWELAQDFLKNKWLVVDTQGIHTNCTRDFEPQKNLCEFYPKKKRSIHKIQKA